MLQSVEAGVSGYALGGDARAALDASLSSFARARLESHVREAANTALPRMKAKPRPSRAQASIVCFAVVMLSPHHFRLTALTALVCAFGWPP